MERYNGVREERFSTLFTSTRRDASNESETLVAPMFLATFSPCSLWVGSRSPFYVVGEQPSPLPRQASKQSVRQSIRNRQQPVVGLRSTHNLRAPPKHAICHVHRASPWKRPAYRPSSKKSIQTHGSSGSSGWSRSPRSPPFLPYSLPLKRR